MKIDVQHIPAEGVSLSYARPADAFPVIKEMISHGECRFSSPVAITLNARPEQEIISVKGELTVTVQLDCGRCLEAFDRPLHRRFSLRFSREIPADVHSDAAGDVELTAEQIGLIFFQDETIDFTEAVQEQLVLAVPYRALCRDSCKGLCPHCGGNLNLHACGCTDKAVDNPFAVLQQRSWPA